MENYIWTILSARSGSIILGLPILTSELPTTNPFVVVGNLLRTLYGDVLSQLIVLVSAALLGAGIAWGFIPNQRVNEFGKNWFFRILLVFVLVICIPLITQYIQGTLPAVAFP